MKRAQWQSSSNSQNDIEAKKVKCEAEGTSKTAFPLVEKIRICDTMLRLGADTSEQKLALCNEVQISQDVSDGATFDNVLTVIEHMDITEPLTTLRQILEQRLGISLSDYTFFLQDNQELDASKTLVNQCVQGEGLVQINVEINTKEDVKKINILDVLKPAEEITLAPDFEFQAPVPEIPSADSSTTSKKVTPTAAAENEHVTRWIASSDFRQLQEDLNIPPDPIAWTEKDVKGWMTWAMNTFTHSSIDLNDWNLNGQELMLMSHEDFIQKVPCDPSDIFWTHIELLRKCKIVAVVQQSDSSQQAEEEVSSTNKVASKAKGRPVKTSIPSQRVICDGCPGGSGQIQLWQFLLELLTDREHRDHIQWIGDEGEFKLINPEIVAQMWGQRKNKPTMNYEKLSRALRYYYDGEMIAKVHGKRFVYKFVCDLKNLLGYSPSTLNRLVTECDIKFREKIAKQ